MKYFGLPSDAERNSESVKMFDVNGKIILKIKVCCPEQGFIKSVCDKYTEYIGKYVFPGIRKDFENSEDERKYLRYPCRTVWIRVIRNAGRGKVTDTVEITREEENTVIKTIPLVIKYY